MSPFIKIAELLGVDEVRVSHSVNASTILVRIGDAWLASTIDFRTLADAKNMTAEIGNILYDLGAALKKSLNIAEARGEDLDRLAATMGMTREPVQRRPASRFEAVVEELKKL